MRLLIKNQKLQRGFIPIIFIIIGALIVASATFGVVKYKDEITANVSKVFKRPKIEIPNIDSTGEDEVAEEPELMEEPVTEEEFEATPESEVKEEQDNTQQLKEQLRIAEQKRLETEKRLAEEKARREAERAKAEAERLKKEAELARLEIEKIKAQQELQGQSELNEQEKIYIPDPTTKIEICKNKAEQGKQYIIDTVTKSASERNTSGTVTPNQLDYILSVASKFYADALNECLAGGELYWAMENAHEKVLRICRQYYFANNLCRDNTDVGKEIEARENLCRGEVPQVCSETEKLKNAWNEYLRLKREYESL